MYWGAGDNTASAGSVLGAGSGAAQGNLSSIVPSAAFPGFNNAGLYRFSFPLRFTTSNDPAYTIIAQIYDQIRVNKAWVTLKCTVNPKQQVVYPPLPSPATQSADFTTVPDYMPDFSWIDWDGSAIITCQTGATPTTIPQNGDVTNFIRQRYGLRRHRAFSPTIRRSIKPHITMYAYSGETPVANPTPPPSNGQQGFQVRKSPWIGINTTGMFIGSVFLAVSYKGPGDPVGAVNFQPGYFWSMRSGHNVSFKCPLWG